MLCQHHSELELTAVMDLQLYNLTCELLLVVQEDMVRQVLEEIRALYEQNQRDV